MTYSNKKIDDKKYVQSKVDLLGDAVAEFYARLDVLVAGIIYVDD